MAIDAQREDEIIEDILGVGEDTGLDPDRPDSVTRLFLGLTVPEVIKAQLRAEAHKHYPQYIKRWIPEENWHLTLLFLGEVKNHTQFFGRLKPALDLPYIPTVQFTHIGRGLKRDQLWAYAVPSPALNYLRDQLVLRLKSMRWPLPHNDYDRFRTPAFMPHVRIATLFPMTAPLGLADSATPATYAPKECRLFRSEITEYGAHYSSELSIPLDGKPSSTN